MRSIRKDNIQHVCICCLILIGFLLFSFPVYTEAEIIKPPLILSLDPEVEWTCGIPFQDPGYTALGESGELLNDSVTVQGEVCSWRVGDYRLTYRLTYHDRTVTASRIVHVVPAELPDTVKVNNAIYLTFDDGPSEYTSMVLDILKKYNIKATFFIVAKHVSSIALLTRIAEEGHTIGIHCYDHGYNKIYSGEKVFFEDFIQAQKIVYQYTGTYAKVSRFPGGSRTAKMLENNTKGGFPEIEKRLHEMGIRYYDWSIQPETGKTIGSTVYQFTHPKERYDGDICLQHDTRSFSVLALEDMIQWGLAEGYVFLPIDSTTPEIHFS